MVLVGCVLGDTWIGNGFLCPAGDESVVDGQGGNTEEKLGWSKASTLLLSCPVLGHLPFKALAWLYCGLSGPA